MAVLMRVQPLLAVRRLGVGVGLVRVFMARRSWLRLVLAARGRALSVTVWRWRHG